LKIRVSGLPMAELDTLLRREIDPARGGLSGIASLDADIRGNDENPVLALELFVDRPGYEQFRFERFKLEATYSMQLLEVYSELFTASDGIRRPPVFFASGSLPVHLAFTGGGARGTGDANLRASMKQFPLALLESFGGLFSPLEGAADADIEVSGPADDLRYNGRLSVSGARGRLAMNNMWYRMNLDVRPEGDVINIHDISVRNDPSDWSEGELSAKGRIKMKGFALEGVGAEVNGQLKVLRRESRAALRSVYGDLYITTKGTPVRFKADPDGSDLSGVVQVLQGNLTYAGGDGDSGPQQFQNINYVEVDDLQKEKEASLGGGGRARMGSLMGRALDAGQADTSEAGEKAMSLNLRYDIAVSTDGPLRVVMPFSSLSQVELNARLNIEQLRVSNALGPGKFTGSVSLGPESYFLMLGKRFDATGSLEFMGDPANPDLRLRAVYSDSHTDQESGATRKVYVLIDITGSREKPELAWDMRWDSPESQSRPRAGAVQSVAFSFILTGLFTDELTSSDRNRIMDQTDAIVSAMASSIISSTASEFLAKAGLQNVFHRLEVGNLNTRDVRLKVTGGIGRVIATYDGKINNLGSSEITFEIPMSMFFPRFGFGRMVMQASRRTTSSTLETGASIPETAVYELKLLYRISF